MPWMALGMDARLTPTGWEQYRQLSTSASGSRKAFVALPVSESEFTVNAFEGCFVPAVAIAGYRLERVIDWTSVPA